MTVYSAINQIPSPELTDIPNAQTAFQALSAVIDTLLVPRFASTALRDAFITAPVEGMMCYVAGEYVPEIYDGTRWITQRELRYGKGATSNSANVTAETTLFTIPSVTFLNGYAYTLRHAGHFTNSSADYTVFNWRKNTISGTTWATHNLVSTVAGTRLHSEQVVYNSTGSDITADVVLTGTSHGGTGVYVGTATDPRLATVELIERASVITSMGIGAALS